MKRIAMLALTAAVMTGCMIFQRPPSEPKAYEPTQLSAAGKYRATFTTTDPIRVGKLHSWNIDVVAADGTPVTDALITVDGGMPQHGHGLPTKPRVVTHLCTGQNVIEGMKFNMGGWWVVTLDIEGAKGRDKVTFNLKL
jgi:hypothetical protein